MIQTPIRSIHCTHKECFDAATFISMNAQTPTWVCPVCDIDIGRPPNPDHVQLIANAHTLSQLYVDLEFANVINFSGRGVEHATWDSDARAWVIDERDRTAAEVVVGMDSDDGEQQARGPSAPTREVIELLDSDSDDDCQRVPHHHDQQANRSQPAALPPGPATHSARPNRSVPGPSSYFSPHSDTAHPQSFYGYTPTLRPPSPVYSIRNPTLHSMGRMNAPDEYSPHSPRYGVQSNLPDPPNSDLIGPSRNRDSNDQFSDRDYDSNDDDDEDDDSDEDFYASIQPNFNNYLSSVTVTTSSHTYHSDSANPALPASASASSGSTTNGRNGSNTHTHTQHVYDVTGFAVDVSQETVRVIPEHVHGPNWHRLQLRIPSLVPPPRPRPPPPPPPLGSQLNDQGKGDHPGTQSRARVGYTRRGRRGKKRAKGSGGNDGQSGQQRQTQGQGGKGKKKKRGKISRGK
ncbi:hypothetical protein BCR44DRAFT_184357 [Catenaria anguillulae PL171]|uniref:SP-RING-type domain-containing protein n=1 Tax=Catenaria anguillulae PL171 TaxID=765915 RepID=A0A1Y2HLT7_9FUNG|nr:hypothetical protein BCR44DRAFT_184357 [Catenaria anguillulae PL171]